MKLRRITALEPWRSRVLSNLWRKALLFVGLAVCAIAARALAYDYSEPMERVSGLPLAFPAKPFGLRFTQEELLNQPIWSNKVDGIVIREDAPSPVRIGAEALHASLVNLELGEAPIVEVASEEEAFSGLKAGGHFIVLGLPKDFAVAAWLARKAKVEVTDTSLNGDGFYIAPVADESSSFLLVASCIPRGAMYGAYEIEERTTARGVPQIDERFMPALRFRARSIFHGTPAPLGIAGRRRENMAVEYGALFPRILPFRDYPMLGGAEHATEIAAQQQALHEIFGDAVRYGSMPTFFFNPLSLQWSPIGIDASREVLADLYPGILADPPERYIFSLCPSHPETPRLVASMVRELIETFPELEMLILQLSDEGGELLCDCAKCRESTYRDRLIEYSRLIIAEARSINPKMRFMLFGSGICNKIAMTNPELAQGPTMGLDVLWERLGNDLDAIMMMATSPPGFDVQTWFSQDSTMLGQGIPTHYMLNWYEAGGPGIVAPISTVMSHLSWPLPLYLDKLQKFCAPGSGTVGGDSPVAGMNVAFWHPDLDPHKCMRNWCRAKYGEEAGDYVYKALVDTHTITEAFHLETKPNANESFNMYRWGPLSKPWAVDMNPLRAVGLGQDDTGQTTLDSIATQGFMFPQAARPDAFEALTEDTMAPWLDRFDLMDETAVGDRAEAMMAKALGLEPENSELKRLYGVARATKALIHLFGDYHLAMVYASTARNTAEVQKRDALLELARSHLRKASANAAVYAQSMLPITKKEKIIRLKRDTDMFYVAAAACLVREAAYLFDQEFGGENQLSHFDEVIGLKGMAQASETPGEK